MSFRGRHFRRSGPFGAVLTLLAMAAGVSPALAQEEIECPTTDVGPIDYTPASGAENVTLDAFLRVHYSEGYFVDVPDAGAFIELFEDLDEAPGFAVLGDPIPGHGELVGDDLYFLPDAPLAANSHYAIVAHSFELEPITSDFRTGGTVDVRPPSIGSVDSPTTERVGPSCGRGSGYRVDLVVRDLIDDGPDSSIELLVYLARQEGLETPELVLRARGTGNAEIPLGFVLTDERANDPACVVVHAVDGVGNVDDSMVPICFEPIQGAFFHGLCAANRVGGEAPGGRASVLSLLLLAFVLVARRRRRAC